MKNMTAVRNMPKRAHGRIVSMQTISVIVLLIPSLGIAESPPVAETSPAFLECGELVTTMKLGYGPYDYTNARHVAERLPVVENHHFTPPVEMLIEGSTGTVDGDLDYTLRAFPNHHRALYAMTRLRLREGNKPSGYPAKCYLERALAYAPNDSAVHVIYGIFLYRSDQMYDAIDYLTNAVRLAPEYAEAQYNLGLALYSVEMYDDAAIHADEALRLGYPQKGLIKKLTEVGHWPVQERPVGASLETASPSVTN